MKIVLTRKELKTALQGLGRVISRTSTLPILRAVRFDAGEGCVTMTATDLDQFCSYRIATTHAQGRKPFIISVNHLKPLIRGAGSELIEIVSGPDANQATVINHIGSQAIRQAVALHAPADWPEEPPLAQLSPVGSFLTNFRRLAPFASRDETRRILQGIYLDSSKKGKRTACMVATDGRRLASLNSMDLPGVTEAVVVPVTKFLCWHRIAKAQIGVTTTERGTWFSIMSGPWAYTVRAIQGTYPNWRQVIPQAQQDHRIVFAQEDVDALRKVLPSFPGHEVDSKPVVLVSDGKTVTVFGRDKETEKWTRFVLKGGTRSHGSRGFIGINREFLLETLVAGFLSASYADSASPIRFEDGKGSVAVVMPVRMDDPVGNATKTGNPDLSGNTCRESKPPQKRRKPMTKTQTRQSSAHETRSALARVVEAHGKLQAAFAELNAAVRDAVREEKSRSKELQAARGALQKLQGIRI